jgi:enoyl-CoA hydratase
MTTGKVTTERVGHVLAIGLDRAAKKNAFDLPMYHALAGAYAELDRDEDLRCGVLFAHGETFTAGLDLAQWGPVFASGSWSLEKGAIDPLGIVGPMCTKPVVCAVQGLCLTIGIELLLATDIRIAAEDARFGQIEINRGIYPVGGATIRMPRECGWGDAMRWLLTGDQFDANEAHRMGMVQEVVPKGTARERAMMIADTISKRAPLGVRATLASARLAQAAREKEAAARLLPDLGPILASQDATEGLQSFLERREARFTGR